MNGFIDCTVSVHTKKIIGFFLFCIYFLNPTNIILDHGQGRPWPRSSRTIRTPFIVSMYVINFSLFIDSLTRWNTFNFDFVSNLLLLFTLFQFYISLDSQVLFCVTKLVKLLCFETQISSLMFCCYLFLPNTNILFIQG